MDMIQVFEYVSLLVRRQLSRSEAGASAVLLSCKSDAYGRSLFLT